MRGVLSALICGIFLSGCLSTPAEPEKYMGFSCDQLDDLADAYRPTSQALLADQTLNRSPESGDTFSTAILQDDSDLNYQRSRDLRSIALARRKKDCR